jgi:hypothetical protein
MTDKTLLWVMVCYVTFLTFIHVKISDFINSRRALSSNAPGISRRMDGWIITIVAMLPVPMIIPEYSRYLGIFYVIVSMIWGIIYFDYIKKDKGEG